LKAAQYYTLVTRVIITACVTNSYEKEMILWEIKILLTAAKNEFCFLQGKRVLLAATQWLKQCQPGSHTF
jgi:hypothetical protein